MARLLVAVAALLSVAAAHTGSLVGDNRVFEAACARLNIIRVRTVEVGLAEKRAGDKQRRIDRRQFAFFKPLAVRL